MRRKDLLIIVASIIIIAFVVVFAIYCNKNDGKIFSNTKVEVAEKNKKYYANGWETALISEIRNEVPIPVGFTYVEGGEDRHLIIKDDITNEQYMWIPYVEPEYSYGWIDEELEEKLDPITEERLESIKKYDGFYVAIEDIEEEFDKYLRENVESLDEYHKAKEEGYYTYEEENLKTDKSVILTQNSLGFEDKDELKAENKGKTNSVETQLISREELKLVQNLRETNIQRINVKNLKSLTILSKSNNEIELEDNESKIEYVIKYIAKVKDEYEDDVKEEIGYDSDIDYNEDEDAFNTIKEKTQDMLRTKEKTNSVWVNIFHDNYIKESDLGDSVTDKDENDNDNEDKDEDDKDEKIEIQQAKWDKKIVTVKDGVPVPVGFTHVEGTKKETGFKIKDTDNLVFIWIPVENHKDIRSEFIEAAESAELQKQEIEDYNTCTDSGDEYDALISSIEMYGGFYISETELGYDENGNSINIYRGMDAKVGSYVSNGDYYRNVKEDNKYKNSDGTYTRLGNLQDEFKLSYEEAIEKCEELYRVSESVVSHLTYGLEYDATVLYLLNEKVITSEQAFNNSKDIGKYSNNQENWNKKETFTLNNIIGLGGNLAEITQEKNSDGEIIVRGGSWNTESTQEKLATKSFYPADDIKKDEDTIGFRACLYIKTEYEDIEEDLKQLREDIMTKVNNEINNITLNNGDKINDLPVIQEIKESIESGIENKTSKTAMEQFANEMLVNIDSIKVWINKIEKYPAKYEVVHGEENLLNTVTDGETKTECDNERNEAINKIKNLSWDEKEGTFISEGVAVILSEIAEPTFKEIDRIREEYRTKVITENIDNYRTEKDNDSIKAIKTKAKTYELNVTEDFDNLNPNKEENLLKKWQEILDLAIAFDEEYSSSKEHYDSWKGEKTNCLTRLAKETTNKTDAENIINDGKNKIQTIIDNKNNPQEPTEPAEPTEPQEPTKPAEPTEPTESTTKTQYQLDVEAGYTIYKSTEVVETDKTLDESKLGKGDARDLSKGSAVVRKILRNQGR